jgi:regulator of sigma D
MTIRNLQTVGVGPNLSKQFLSLHLVIFFHFYDRHTIQRQTKCSFTRPNSEADFCIKLVPFTEYNYFYIYENVLA